MGKSKGRVREGEITLLIVTNLVEREPLSEQEVIDYLNKDYKAKEEELGIGGSIFLMFAKKDRDEKIAKFKAGEIIEVAEEPYIGTMDGRDCFFKRVLLSNGKIKIICNGFCD